MRLYPARFKNLGHAFRYYRTLASTSFMEDLKTSQQNKVLHGDGFFLPKDLLLLRTIKIWLRDIRG